MGLDCVEFRERIGLFYPISRSIKRKKRLSLFDIVCVSLLVTHGLKILPLIVLLSICLTASPYYSTKNLEEISTWNGNCKLNTFNMEPVLKIMFLCFVISMLLIIAGVEVNPGPEDQLSDSFSSLSSETNNFSLLSRSNISFIHLNVQSILPKLNQLSIEYSNYEILSFTESWLRPSVSNEQVAIQNFNTFRNDRLDRVGGGVIVYVKDNINCQERPDLKVANLESIWLEIRLKNKTYLFGTFYMPPDCNQQDWEYFCHSIELALNLIKI